MLREAYRNRKIPKAKLPSVAQKMMAIFNFVQRQVLPELDRRRFASWEKASRVLDWHPRPAREAILASAETLIELRAIQFLPFVSHRCARLSAT